MFLSVRQKGKTRVYGKRRPISQSSHRAGPNTASGVCKESLKAFPCLSKEKSPALFSAEVPHYKLFQCTVFCFTALNPTRAAYVFYFNSFSLFYDIYLDLIFFPPPKSLKSQVRCLQGAYVHLHKHLEILKNCFTFTEACVYLLF